MEAKVKEPEALPQKPNVVIDEKVSSAEFSAGNASYDVSWWMEPVMH